MFSKKLTDLINEKDISISKLAEKLNTAKSVVSYWKNGKSLPQLDKALCLKAFFNCSLDYLFGSTDFEDVSQAKQISTFDKQLRRILKDRKITREKFLTDLNMSNNNFNSWYKVKSNPRMDTIVKIADYLQVSIDYLVGIE